MKQYTPAELMNIFRRIAPQPGLFVPFQPVLQNAPRTGPSVCVYIRYSDIVTGAGDLEQKYWEALRRTPVLGAIGALAVINGILSEVRGGNTDIHRGLNERFLTPELRAKVSQYQPGGAAFAGVFNKPGCLQLMRHLLLYGDMTIASTDQKVDGLGELMLLANQFIQIDPNFSSGQPSNLDLLVSLLPAWDICNPRDLAHTLSRMFTMLTEILPGSDPEVQRLRSKLGLDPSAIRIGQLSLNDFVSVVFGLYAYGRQMTTSSPDRAVFDVRKVFSKIEFPESLLSAFVNDRGLRVEELKQRLAQNRPCTRESFTQELAQRPLFTQGLNCFRQFPLLRLDENRALILDLQFLVDLLTSGVYWSIFDGLPENRRETFRELWGRLFELYATSLLGQFYPPGSGFLTVDLQHGEGQIDAMLDFGADVPILETKASLLTEGAKRAVSKEEFVKDFTRKFVQNEKGAPKAVLQLASSCKAAEEGKIKTATKPIHVYPVFVSDEPAVETFLFNAYVNEVFESKSARGARVQPVTVMSINELEELLPYVSSSTFTWAELLRSRFTETGVGPFSVHQAIYDLAQIRGFAPQRNEALRKKFDEVWQIISNRYKDTAQGNAANA
jgi:hypothetical protein